MSGTRVTLVGAQNALDANLNSYIQNEGSNTALAGKQAGNFADAIPIQELALRAHLSCKSDLRIHLMARSNDDKSDVSYISFKCRPFVEIDELDRLGSDIVRTLNKEAPKASAYLEELKALEILTKDQELKKAKAINLTHAFDAAKALGALDARDNVRTLELETLIKTAQKIIALDIDDALIQFGSATTISDTAKALKSKAEKMLAPLKTTQAELDKVKNYFETIQKGSAQISSTNANTIEPCLWVKNSVLTNHDFLNNLMTSYPKITGICKTLIVLRKGAEEISTVFSNTADVEDEKITTLCAKLDELANYITFMYDLFSPSTSESDINHIQQLIKEINSGISAIQQQVDARLDSKAIETLQARHANNPLQLKAAIDHIRSNISQTVTELNNLIGILNMASAMKKISQSGMFSSNGGTTTPPAGMATTAAVANNNGAAATTATAAAADEISPSKKMG